MLTSIFATLTQINMIMLIMLKSINIVIYGINNTSGDPFGVF